MANEKDKVYNLVVELTSNNHKAAKLAEEAKKTKDAIKAFTERNAEIMDELKVHTEDDNLTPDTY